MCVLFSFGGIPIFSFIFTKTLPFHYKYILDVKYKGLRCALGEILDWSFILAVSPVYLGRQVRLLMWGILIRQSYYYDNFHHWECQINHVRKTLTSHLKMIDHSFFNRLSRHQKILFKEIPFFFFFFSLLLLPEAMSWVTPLWKLRLSNHFQLWSL